LYVYSPRLTTEMVRLSTIKYDQLRSNYGNSTSIQSKLSVASFFNKPKNINPSTIKLFIRATVITTFTTVNYGLVRSVRLSTVYYGLLR